jgi:hypothetical protein
VVSPRKGKEHAINLEKASESRFNIFIGRVDTILLHLKCTDILDFVSFSTMKFAM